MKSHHLSIYQGGLTEKPEQFFMDTSDCKEIDWIDSTVIAVTDEQGFRRVYSGIPFVLTQKDK